MTASQGIIWPQAAAEELLAQPALAKEKTGETGSYYRVSFWQRKLERLSGIARYADR